MNVKCHVSDFMLIDRDLHSLLQNISEHGCCLKFIMKKYSDIICQWIADLLLIPDSRNSKGDMICQRDHDPAVYFPKNFFCFPDHLIGDFQKFRIHLLHQRFGRSSVCLFGQAVSCCIFCHFKTLTDLLSKANSFTEKDVFLVILCIDCDHAIIIQNFAYSVHI